VEELQHGALYRFADWPSDAVPRQAAGVYTIWRQRQLLYAGMSGRGAQHEDLVASTGPRGGPWGLWTRLNSHASGRRSGDQFNLYVCDRFIVPALDRQQLRQIGEGDLSLDQLTKTFICGQLSYRFLICPDGRQALDLERRVRAGSLPAGRPYLNPLDREGSPTSHCQH
jgi:hypothetical protein